MNYLTLADCIDIHTVVVEYEAPIIPRIDYLKSVLAHIQNDIYYPTLTDKATHLLYSICKLHPFIDGNKRAALTITYSFLRINDVQADILNIHWSNIVIKVAENSINKDELKTLLANQIQ